MKANFGIAGLAALLCLGSTVANAAADAPVRCSFVHDDLMLAVSDPPPGREKEYNDFFGNVHIPEVVSRGIGFEGAQRFIVRAHLGAAPWKYLSLYALSRYNQVAKTGVKFKPGPTTPTPPAHYLADGSAAWILARVAPGDTNAADRQAACASGQKLFVVLSAPPARPGLEELARTVPGLKDAVRYEFKTPTKGGPAPWIDMVVLRATPDVDVPATLSRLGAAVGCTQAACPESSGAVWAVEPLAEYLHSP